MTKYIPKNIVSVMIKQHRGLQKELVAVLDIQKDKQPDFVKISNLLVQFKKDLAEHLKLEDTVFYKELLIKMKEKGQDTTNTEKFIDEMDEIAKEVEAFLKEFGTSEKIKNNFNKFKNDFGIMVETLTLRIESEETGVYSYWGLF